MRIGVLALQGDFEAHRNALQRAGATAVEVRTKEELELTDGLVIPGGESTTMLKLLRLDNMFDSIRDYGTRRPIFGTCAGAILLARSVTSPVQDSLGLVDIEVERNAYGRQIDSRIVSLQPEPESGMEGEVEAVFIRAPIIRTVGPEVRVLLRYGSDPVLAEHGRHMVGTFHPELTADGRVHRRFVEKVDGK